MYKSCKLRICSSNLRMFLERFTGAGGMLGNLLLRLSELNSSCTAWPTYAMSGLLLPYIYIYIFFCNPVQATVHVTEAGDANGSAGVLWPSPSQGREWRGRPTAFSNLCRSLLTPVVRHYRSVHALSVCTCIYFSLSLLFFSLSRRDERLEELEGSVGNFTSV